MTQERTITIELTWAEATAYVTRYFAAADLVLPFAKSSVPFKIREKILAAEPTLLQQEEAKRGTP